MTAPRLRMEPLAPRHASVLFADLRDPSLYAFIPDEPPAALAALVARYERLHAGAPPDRDERWLNWVMLDAGDDRPVGTLQATVYPDGRAVIAYLVVTRCQRRGYAREGVAWMIDQLATHHAVVRVEAYIDTRNRASIALVEALGLRETRRIPAADHFKGAVSDEVVHERRLAGG